MLNTLIFFFQRRVLYLATGLFLILWALPAQAALLKDIRLGEYKTFTRIVFELDQAPPAIPDISGSPGELRVTFTGITADLTRKIPIKQSPHVNAIQIWIEDNQLSAVLKVDAPFTHGEVSSINNPPRLLVDVHWQATAQGLRTPAAAGPPPVQDASSTDASEVPSTPEATAAPLNSQKESELPAYSQPASIPDDEAPAVEMNDPTRRLSSADDTPLPEAIVLEPPATPSGAKLDLPPSKPNRLQYYLVIGLVVLTIAILMLLVVMLLTKYKWANDRLLFNDDHLKEQQAMIEKINGRIQEQLKHYEKS